MIKIYELKYHIFIVNEELNYYRPLWTSKGINYPLWSRYFTTTYAEILLKDLHKDFIKNLTNLEYLQLKAQENSSKHILF